MTKLVAITALMVAMIASTLGNYWFTFGLWPISWWSFAGFAFANVILGNLLSRIADEKSK